MILYVRTQGSRIVKEGQHLLVKKELDTASPPTWASPPPGTRRPPTDPVNAVLSLLYTFLLNRGYAAVRLAHLDPFLAICTRSITGGTRWSWI